MNIAFVSNDPFNSPVVDTATGQVIMQVSTPFRVGKRKTTVCDARGRVVGEFTRRWGHDVVSYHGETMRVRDWLPKKGHWSRHRIFYAPNGKVYMWKQRWGSRSFKLVDTSSHHTVARTHTKTHGFCIAPSEPMGIDIEPELMPILDAVVLSFVICEKARRQKSHGSGAAAAGSAA